MDGISMNDLVPGAGDGKESFPFGKKPLYGFFGSSSLSRLGYNTAAVCVAWYVFSSTHSAIAVGIVALVESLAATAGALPAGALVDRLNRAFLVVVSMVLGAVSLGILAWFSVFYGFNLYVLMAAAAVWSIGLELFRSASSSILPDIVEPNALPRANGMNRAISSTVGSIANAMAGGLIIAVGVAAAVAGSAAVFAVSAVTAAFLIFPSVGGKISGREGQQRPGRNMGMELKEGLHWLLSERGLWELTISATFFNFFFSLSFSYMVIYVAASLHADSLVYGTVLAVYAVGDVAGSLLPGYIHPLAHAGKIWVFMYGLAVGLSLLLMGALPYVPEAIILGLSIGIFAGFSGNVWLTSAQNLVPSGMRGRYFAIDGVLSFIGGPPAIATGAVLISVIGVSSTFLLTGILMATSAMIFGSMKGLRGLDGRPRDSKTAMKLQE